MSSITVRNLPEETHRALRVRAAMAGRSTEAEVRAILEQVCVGIRQGLVRIKRPFRLRGCQATRRLCHGGAQQQSGQRGAGCQGSGETQD